MSDVRSAETGKGYRYTVSCQFLIGNVRHILGMIIVCLEEEWDYVNSS